MIHPLRGRVSVHTISTLVTRGTPMVTVTGDLLRPLSRATCLWRLPDNPGRPRRPPRPSFSYTRVHLSETGDSDPGRRAPGATHRYSYDSQGLGTEVGKGYAGFCQERSANSPGQQIEASAQHPRPQRSVRPKKRSYQEALHSCARLDNHASST